LRKLLCLLLMSAFCLSIHAQDQRGPSTPEERQRMVALVHKMEQAPNDESLRPEIEWALKWLVEIPDISVSVCTAPFGKFWKEKYKGVPDHFVAQFTFAMAAFIIEHPDAARNNDKVAQYTAGMESVLRAYQSVLKNNPKARSRNLDDLLQKQKEGKLGDFIRSASEECK
jgi:hypothetical protein